MYLVNTNKPQILKFKIMKKNITTLAIAMLGIAFVSNAQVDSTYQSGSSSAVDSSFVGSGNGSDSSFVGSGNESDSSFVGSGNGSDSSFVGSGNGSDSSFVGSGNGSDSSFVGSGNESDSSFVGSGNDLFNGVTIEEGQSGFNISWQADSTNYSFCVQVATDSAFTNLITNVCNIQNNSYEVLFIDNSGSVGNDSTNANQRRSAVNSNYFWRVGATDANAQTAWIATRVVSTSQTLTITGLESKLATSAVSAYPNPAADVLFVTATDAASVELLDVNGTSVLSANGNVASKGLNVAHVAAGIYVLKVNQDSDVKTFRIVKQ